MVNITAARNDESPSTCPVCHITLNRKFDMSRHMKRHRPDRDQLMHHCTHEGCSYKNLQRSNVVTHMRIHTGERNQLCPDCDFATTDPGSLTRHRKNRHGYEPLSRRKTNSPPKGSPQHTPPADLHDDPQALISPATCRVASHHVPSTPSTHFTLHKKEGSAYKDVSLTQAISSWLKGAWTPLMRNGNVFTSSVPLLPCRRARISFRKSDFVIDEESSSQHRAYVWEIWLDARYLGGIACPIRYWMEPVQWCLEWHDEKGIHSIDKDCIIWALTIIILANSQNNTCSEVLHIRPYGQFSDSFALCNKEGSKALVFGKRWGEDAMSLDD